MLLFGSFQRAHLIQLNFLKGSKNFEIRECLCQSKSLGKQRKERHCVRPSNEEPTMEQHPEPTTPRNMQRKRPLSTDDSWTDDDSPRKKPRTPQTPSKAAQKKAEAAQRRQQKDDWVQWVARSEWVKDQSYGQKVGTFEIHKGEGKPSYETCCYLLGTNLTPQQL